MDENKIIKPIAVTISGFIIGMLLTFKIISFNTFLLLDKPMAVMVPKIVEINVAKRAMVIDTDTAFIMELSEIRLLYHWKENPDIFVSDFDELKENTIMTIMGRYKNKKHTAK